MSTSETSEECFSRLCALCGCSDMNEYEDRCFGEDVSCDESNPYPLDSFVEYTLKEWVRPLIVSSFGHCHSSHRTGHVYGTLDSNDNLFKLLWTNHTNALEPECPVAKCPQCKGDELRSSSTIFNEGKSRVKFFHCYVCSKGCVSCYISRRLSGMACSVSNIRPEKEGGQRIDLSSSDSDVPKHIEKREREETAKDKTPSLKIKKLSM